MSTVGLFQLGDFTLASGQPTSWKIECDALTAAEWHALAFMLVERLPGPFEAVHGVPRGGEPFAKALRPHCTPECGYGLVVDDVWTTGQSMRRYIETTRLDHGRLMRAVVFARNVPGPAVTALFTMPGLP